MTKVETFKYIKDYMLYHGEYRTPSVANLCISLEIAMKDRMSIDCMLKHEDGDIKLIVKRGKVIKVLAKHTFKGMYKLERLKEVNDGGYLQENRLQQI